MASRKLSGSTVAKYIGWTVTLAKWQRASTISMPFKLLLFVVVDGWALITTALVGSYGGGG